MLNKQIHVGTEHPLDPPLLDQVTCTMLFPLVGVAVATSSDLTCVWWQCAKAGQVPYMCVFVCIRKWRILPLECTCVCVCVCGTVMVLRSHSNVCVHLCLQPDLLWYLCVIVYITLSRLQQQSGISGTNLDLSELMHSSLTSQSQI